MDKNGQIYTTHKVSFWEKLGNNLRMLIGIRKNSAREDLVGKLANTPGNMIEEARKWWPDACKSSQEELQALLANSILSLEPATIDQSIQKVKQCLGKGVQDDARDSNPKYLHFLQRSLEGSAGTAHALLRTFEKYAGKFYEEVDDALGRSTSGESASGPPCCRHAGGLGYAAGSHQGLPGQVHVQRRLQVLHRHDKGGVGVGDLILNSTGKDLRHTNTCLGRHGP